jgi:peptide/nickel transport system permease protein
MTIPILFATTLLIFVFMSVSGDPLGQVRQIPNVSQETIDNLVEENHLDRPILIQYAYWLKEAVTQGFGNTLLSDEPIWPDLSRVMGNTLQLIIAAETIAVLLAIGLGVLSAVRQYSVFDYGTTTFSFVAFSMPVFWLAIILQVIFTNIYLNYGYRVFYTAQLSSPDPENWLLDRAQHLALPVFTIAVVQVAQYSRYVRAAMLEVLSSDYVRTARAKGLLERKVIFHHSLRNALIPLATVIGVNFGALFGGAVATETVFALDGMGLYFLKAVSARDVYSLMAWLTVTSLIVVVFNLVVDLAYAFLDPRIRYD